MVMDTVNLKLVGIALSEVDTTNFERFAQAFYSAIFGMNFVPMGGMHDGGADGYIEPELFHDKSQSHFLQASKQSTHITKITETVKRLKESRQIPKSLTYITSITITKVDVDEDSLSDTLGCRIRIRDSKYIESHINHSSATVAAFNTFLRPFTDHLLMPGAAAIPTIGVPHADRTLAVFLRQEVENRSDKSDLLQSVADSLILWSLSGTDPETGKFMVRDEILSRIESALPSAQQFIRGIFDDRLKALRSKSPGVDRQIRYYMQEKKYCLPYETREIVKQENIDDLSLRSDVSEILSKRFELICSENEKELSGKVIEYCHKTFETLFEKQGLELARFVANEDADDELYTNVNEIVSDLLEREELDDSQSVLRRLVLRVLRGTFYDTTEQERTYLLKLSKTYVLMLVLRNEPKIVDYFSSVSSSLNLYIGTDFIVRALSEHYLGENNQTTCNLFRILSAAGATCILTETTVDEVSTHLRSQIFEFENYYMHIENEMKIEMVEYIDRILIRSYFYSRLALAAGITPPGSWDSFIEQFGSYTDIRANRGSSAIGRYLVAKFGFEYETADEMLRGLDEGEVQSLADKILQEKTRKRPDREGAEVLAYNDALHTHLVYHRRREHKERSLSNPFGFRTWWLTQDSSVRRAAASLADQNGNQRFMMRPEFLLNFILMNPEKADVEKSYRSIFPSTLGVQLSNRMDAQKFKEVMKQANDMWSRDPARASVIISESLNELKGDQIKRYEHNW